RRMGLHGRLVRQDRISLCRSRQRQLQCRDLRRVDRCRLQDQSGPRRSELPVLIGPGAERSAPDAATLGAGDFAGLSLYCDLGLVTVITDAGTAAAETS